MIFVTSDTHFNHANIIKYCNRPFSSTKEMNEELIRRWNAKVSKNDIVIHLGDFAFGRNWESIKDIRNKLNGIIILVVGNHDYNKAYQLGKAGIIIARGSLQIKSLILTHEPMAIKDIPEGFINVHGHIHQRESPLGNRGINVSTEKTDYSPILLNEISEILFKKL